MSVIKASSKSLYVYNCSCYYGKWDKHIDVFQVLATRQGKGKERKGLLEQNVYTITLIYLR